MINNPNQLEINFPPDEPGNNKKEELKKESELPYELPEKPGWDLYEKNNEIAKEKEEEKKKNERSEAYKEMKSILDKEKFNTIKLINYVCGREMDTKSSEGFNKLRNLQNSWQRSGDERAFELGRLMGKLATLRIVCKLSYKEPNKCLKYVKDLRFKPGVGANELVQSPIYNKILKLIIEDTK